ncbi:MULTISPECIES: FAD-dependent monooxygenase [Streptomyces]|uniref:FAD-binding domain-containing protein n=1 Tax=Streptomyces yunnanensis TaxID=156453 RepID=A0A9X8QXZ4_9ACTN|nr:MULTISPECIES: FAD-dependent monooxygenase [Streptomyces]SHM94509.1 hypothetical protein SAMN05216268_116197 [Streptomyces yunnanensis]
MSPRPPGFVRGPPRPYSGPSLGGLEARRPCIRSRPIDNASWDGFTRTAFDGNAAWDSVRVALTASCLSPHQRGARREGERGRDTDQAHWAAHANHLGLDHTGHAYRTAGRLIALHSARHNAEARAVFYFAAPQLEVDRRDVARQQAILAETFAGNGWESDRLLQDMRYAPDFYFDSVGQVHMDTWSRGRVALLGDAAYCPSSLSGMGSGLALVGAYVLAGELAAARGDHRVAFERYEEEMREYAVGCQKMGNGVAKLMVPGSRALATLLNRYYKVMPYLPGKNMASKTARKAAENIRLRDYRERARS